MTAETKTVGNGMANSHFASRVRHVVEVAGWIGEFVIDRRVDDAVANTQGADDQLDATAGRACAIMLLVLLTASFAAWLPNTFLMALVSASSPSGVLVP